MAIKHEHVCNKKKQTGLNCFTFETNSVIIGFTLSLWTCRHFKALLLRPVNYTWERNLQDWTVASVIAICACI